MQRGEEGSSSECDFSRSESRRTVRTLMPRPITPKIPKLGEENVRVHPGPVERDDKKGRVAK